MTYRLLAVHAHPDDESSKGAGTYAMYEDRGAEVMIVSCTGGEAGDILNTAVPSRAHAQRDLPGLRRVEMAEAQRILGIEHRWLGYRDSGMPADGVVPADSFAAIPIEISVRPMVRLIREFRPHVMVTYDENGGYPHPDHIRTHEVSIRAWELSGDEEYRPELGSAWSIQKLYYDRTMNSNRYQSLLHELKKHSEHEHLADRMEAMLARVLEHEQARQGRIGARINVAEYLQRRDAALRSHSSQVAPNDAFFFGYPRDLEAVAYPFEDYELVMSRVAAPGGDPAALETDLFAGIIDEGAW